ncbi:right-handed parallel beta-helix repeat-containing protein [Sorangium sp. So ce1036]|uniref:right-handed parallel beta-helix repeat-containing protein n=1 Tax=Sorangium sp. So ce1036 TaxID=3133328 RepID=UPI003EFC2524
MTIATRAIAPACLILLACTPEQGTPYLEVGEAVGQLSCSPDGGAPSVIGGMSVINVRDYGATGRGCAVTGDESDEIQSAIDSAAQCGTPYPVVYFPPGNYCVENRINAKVDNLTLLGGTAATLQLNADVIALTVTKLSASNEFLPVKNVTIDNLSIDATSGHGQDNAGVLNLNNCVDCTVRNVRILGSPSATSRRINGISTSNGTTGTIDGVVVDGMSKPGIQASYRTGVALDGSASGGLRIINSTFKNMITGGAGPAPGIAIWGGSRVIVSSCQSYNNAGDGVQIAVVSYPPDNSLGTAAKDIQILGGQFWGNGQNGILIGSVHEGNAPTDVAISQAQVFDNDQHGIRVTAVKNLRIDDVTLHDNGEPGLSLRGHAGAILQQVSVTNPIVYNNMKLTAAGDAYKQGISIVGTTDVTISGGKIFDDQATPTQLNGIKLFPEDLVATGTPPQRLRILDVDVSQVPGVQHSFAQAYPNGAIPTGYFRLIGNGAPEGSLYAPLGSEYVDLTSGVSYRKVAASGATPGATGWKQVVTQ